MRSLLLFFCCVLVQACSATATGRSIPNGESWQALNARSHGSYSVVYSFKGEPDGAFPNAGLTILKGKLYGTTTLGGVQGDCETGGCGAIFAFDPGSGQEAVLYAFKGGGYAYEDGANPLAGLRVLNGILYGTTPFGGKAEDGTVFAFKPTSSQERVVYSFGGPDGSYPTAAVISVNHALYGTTEFGGYNYGTIVSIDPKPPSLERVLYAFRGGKDGQNPEFGLVAIHGILYGTTLQGGYYANGSGPGFGTVFAYSHHHKRILYRFQGGGDGANPDGPLIDVNGVLYGTTGGGGANGYGTVFAMTPSGKKRIVCDFRGGKYGASPRSGLLNVNGALYGIAGGGVGCSGSGCGILFEVTSSGEERVLHRFLGGSDGASPNGPLVSLDGVLYGTTNSDGSNGYGTIFRLTP
jgi:uncharacterized repeat protein (TIGR03803 family)